ncbi:MAG: HNH endonuclease [Candidatus Taylorbacteria bacterium]|nr:HNH endonuclease [Candidatus Taylorbacteria bacterium]
MKCWTKIKEWLGIFPSFGGIPRSSQWPKVRAEFLKTHPKCAVCGTTKDLAVHHKKPYFLYPELELDSRNLITLCDGLSHHLIFGHLGSYLSYNKNIDEDSLIWWGKFSTRPVYKSKVVH